MIHLTTEDEDTIRTAYERVQQAADALQHADPRYIDGAVFRLAAAQADYDVLVEELLGVTVARRQRALERMRDAGLHPEYAQPTG